jgi:hypothetical protein
VRRQHAQCDGEVERRPPSARPRGEVDQDARVGHPEPLAAQRHGDPLRAFLDGGVGQTDHDELEEAAARDVDLDFDE